MAVSASSSQIDLSWQDNSTNETGFRIERSLDGVNFKLAGIVSAGETHFSATGLSVNTTYYFRVSATNPDGDSPWSSTIQATPRTPLPDALESNNTWPRARNLGTRDSFT